LRPCGRRLALCGGRLTLGSRRLTLGGLALGGLALGGLLGLVLFGFRRLLRDLETGLGQHRHGPDGKRQHAASEQKLAGLGHGVPPLNAWTQCNGAPPHWFHRINLRTA
jgi:hypothetical protein